MAIIKKFRIKSFKNEKPILSLKKVSLSFGKRKILDNINFDLNKGQVLGLLGPNGVGKSTIFNLIIGLIKPDYGSIIVGSTNVNEYPIYLRTKEFKLGYCPQNSGYFHDLTLLENLNSVGQILISDKKIRDEKIDSMISKFELEPVMNVKANHLSGGQKKKISYCTSSLR